MATPKNGYPIYIGWYQPHPPVDYTDEIPDPVTGELVRQPSMTKQSFVAECDINNIIKDFKVTGQIAHINAQARQGAYLDLPPALDFQESLDLVNQAEAAFATLPAHVRAQLGNNPATFLEYVQDPANHDQLVKWGLAKPPETAPTGATPPAPAGGPPSAETPPAGQKPLL